MPEQNDTTFTDPEGGRWRISLRASFWLWLLRADPAQLNAGAVLYVALRNQLRAAGISPARSVYLTSSPQALRALLAAIREWTHGS